MLVITRGQIWQDFEGLAPFLHKQIKGARVSQRYSLRGKVIAVLICQMFRSDVTAIYQITRGHALDGSCKHDTTKSARALSSYMQVDFVQANAKHIISQFPMATLICQDENLMILAAALDLEFSRDSQNNRRTCRQKSTKC